MKECIAIILPGWKHTQVNWLAFADFFDAYEIPWLLFEFAEFSSSESAPAKSIPEVAERTAAELRSAYPDREIILVGHSFGGRVAVEIVAHKLLETTGLVLIGSPNIYRPNWKVRLKKILSAAAKPITRFLPASWRERFRSDDYQNVANSPLQDLFLQTIQHDQTKLLPHIHQNTLIIWGDQDAQAPIRLAAEIDSLLPTSKLETLKNVGHDVHADKPQLLAAKIAEYVKNL